MPISSTGSGYLSPSRMLASAPSSTLTTMDSASRAPPGQAQDLAVLRNCMRAPCGCLGASCACGKLYGHIMMGPACAVQARESIAMPSIHLEHDGALARLLIDHPERRNAISRAMWRSIPPLLAQA